jgi:hypothetical protein
VLVWQDWIGTEGVKLLFNNPRRNIYDQKTGKESLTGVYYTPAPPSAKVMELIPHLQGKMIILEVGCEITDIKAHVLKPNGGLNHYEFNS